LSSYREVVELLLSANINDLLCIRADYFFFLNPPTVNSKIETTRSSRQRIF